MKEPDSTVVSPERRRLLRGLMLGGVAIGGGAVGATAAAATTGGGSRRQSLTVDVACIGDLWREGEPVNRADPSSDFRAPFLVEGWIYPAGTIPGDGFVPTPDGSIGRWFCRGWVAIDGDRLEPHAASHQDYVFGSITPDALFPPDTMASAGLEGTETDQVGTRAVVGGTGAYFGATGSVRQVNKGVNTTVLFGFDFPAPNFTFEFDLLLPAV